MLSSSGDTGSGDNPSPMEFSHPGNPKWGSSMREEGTYINSICSTGTMYCTYVCVRAEPSLYASTYLTYSYNPCNICGCFTISYSYLDRMIHMMIQVTLTEPMVCISR